VTAGVVVSYTVSPDRLEEHLGLIAGVFEQLRAEEPSGVDYQVLRLADGVGFVHVGVEHVEGGLAALTSMSAFGEFARGLGERATPPVASPAAVVGAYRAVPG